MKDYVLATITRDGKAHRKRVFRNVTIMRRYYDNIFDFSHREKAGYPALSSINTFLDWEYILLIEAQDC